MKAVHGNRRQSAGTTSVAMERKGFSGQGESNGEDVSQEEKSLLGSSVKRFRMFQGRIIHGELQTNASRDLMKTAALTICDSLSTASIFDYDAKVFRYLNQSQVI
jgi:hypothetical protein